MPEGSDWSKSKRRPLPDPVDVPANAPPQRGGPLSAPLPRWTKGSSLRSLTSMGGSPAPWTNRAAPQPSVSDVAPAGSRGTWCARVPSASAWPRCPAAEWRITCGWGRPRPALGEPCPAPPWRFLRRAVRGHHRTHAAADRRRPRCGHVHRLDADRPGVDQRGSRHAGCTGGAHAAAAARDATVAGVPSARRQRSRCRRRRRRGARPARLKPVRRCAGGRSSGG